MKSELEVRRAVPRLVQTLKAVLKRPSSPDTAQQAAVLRSTIGMAHWVLGESNGGGGGGGRAIQEFLDTVGTILQCDGEQN